MLTVRQLGLVDYAETFTAMKDFTDRRAPDTADEFWLLQHRPVYTLGLNADPAHVLAPGDIPVVKVDRGGQVTYHGPGQLVVYTLIDLKRAGLGIRDLVSALENSVIKLVGKHGIDAAARCDAPGVYVDDRKLASIGLRVRRGCSYHGLSLNVSMDIEPFTRINPCGFDDLLVTQLADLGLPTDLESIGEEITALLATELGLDTNA